MAENFATQIEVFTLNHILPKYADNIGNASRTLALFTSSGRTDANGKSVPMTKDELITGGRNIQRGIRSTRSTARGSYTGWDTLDVDPNRQFDAAEQPFREYYASIMIDFTTELGNRGKEGVVNYLDSLYAASFSDVNDMIATGIFNSAATRIGLQAKGINGLREFCSSGRTWMGINSITETYWDAMYDTTGHTIANLSDPTHADYIQKTMREMFRNCSVMGKTPTHIVTTKSIYDIYLESMLSQQRFAGSREGSLGFEVLKFEGAEVFWDDYCPAYHMFFLNMSGTGNDRIMGLKGRRGAWFELTPWKTPANQIGKVRQLIVHLNLYGDNPRLVGSYTALANA